jgi:hypothetical protein
MTLLRVVFAFAAIMLPLCVLVAIIEQYADYRRELHEQRERWNGLRKLTS